MKRFHVHVAVSDLHAGIGFYSTLFGIEPTVVKPDYAKWMLDDPRVNFAISQRGRRAGIDHLGMQVDGDEELEEIRARLAAADASVAREKNVACCYARSDKYWVTDPAGIAWESFRTLGSVEHYGDDSPRDAHRTAVADAACCGPSTERSRCCG